MNTLQKRDILSLEILLWWNIAWAGALATHFATKHDKLKSLILICPIYDLQNLGENFLTNTRVGVGTPHWIRNLTKNLKPLSWLHSLRFSTARKIDKVKTPTYLIQSKNDSVTTIENARVLAKKAKRSEKLEEFHIFPLGGHKVDKVKIDCIGDILDKISNI